MYKIPSIKTFQLPKNSNHFNAENIISDKSIIHLRSVNRSDLIKSSRVYEDINESSEIRYHSNFHTPSSSTDKHAPGHKDLFKMPMTKENHSILIPECDVIKQFDVFVNTFSTPRQLPKSIFPITPAR